MTQQEEAYESQEAPAAAEGEEAAAVSSEAQENAGQPHGFLDFILWMLLCGCIAGPSPPIPPSSAAREEASPPPFAAGEDQPPHREAAAAGGTTTATANPRQDARQPQHGSSFENLVWSILLCGPPMRPADEAAAGADEGGQNAPATAPGPALAPAPAPAADQPLPLVPVDDSSLKSQTISSSSDQPDPVVPESLLGKIFRESRQMILEGKGELKIEEAFHSKPHPDCSPEFAAILHAADAAIAAAAARGQSKSSSGSSSDDGSSSSPSPSPSESEPKTEKEKGKEKEKEKKKERDPAGN